MDTRSSLFPQNDSTLAAWNRAWGTTRFYVTVTAPGYVSWSQTGLEARSTCPGGERARVRVPLTRSADG